MACMCVYVKQSSNIQNFSAARIASKVIYSHGDSNGWYDSFSTVLLLLYVYLCVPYNDFSFHYLCVSVRGNAFVRRWKKGLTNIFVKSNWISNLFFILVYVYLSIILRFACALCMDPITVYILVGVYVEIQVLNLRAIQRKMTNSYGIIGWQDYHP